MMEELKKEFGGWSPTIVNAANLQPYFREYCREWRYPSFEAAKATAGVEGFIVWIGYKWMEWRNETNKQGELTNEDHAAFAAWLPSRVDENLTMEPPRVDSMKITLRKRK